MGRHDNDNQFDEEYGTQSKYNLNYAENAPQPREHPFDHQNFKLDIRLSFIRKVYGILATQIIFTIFFASAGMFFKGFNEVIRLNPLVVYVAIAVYFVIYIILLCFTRIARKVPINYFLLILYTISMSYIVAYICAIYQHNGKGYLVFMALLMTAVLVIGLTMYACITKTDFTICGGFLLCMAISLALFSIASLILHSYYFQIGLTCVSLMLAGIYLVYDTQLLLGRKKHNLTTDDYIVGALMLYVDIIIIFLDLLEILSCVE